MSQWKRQKRARHGQPIASVPSGEERLIEKIKNNNILIINGDPSLGKTIKLLHYILEAGVCQAGMVGITQPSPIAAVTVAKRVAEELDFKLGEEVGYSIRFDDKTSDSTSFKYMTDELLLREALLDPHLSRYSVIVVDEAHERTVHTDVLLALLKKIQCGARSKPFGKLPPLKLIIMSASLDARIFCKYFGAEAHRVEERQFPVEIIYAPHHESHYIDAALTTIFKIHSEEKPGDILVFLTGQEEIEAVESLVKERLKSLPREKRKLLPLSILSEQQMQVFATAENGFRKVVLATNIAETSIIIPGIRYVIDPGFVKAQNYDPSKEFESLVVLPASNDRTCQRSRCAGREGEGKCFRLYPKSVFEKLEWSTKPEINRCHLSNVILQLKALGIDDIVGLDLIEKPSRDAVNNAVVNLKLLGALTDDCQLHNPAGYQMSLLPLDPVYSRALILANKFECLEEMLITIAMLSVESIFSEKEEELHQAREARKHLTSPEGDHLTYLRVYRESDKLLKKGKRAADFDEWCKKNFVNSLSLKHARDTLSQIRGYVKQIGFEVSSCGADTLTFCVCLSASFIFKVASRQTNGTYRSLGSREVVQFHPTSVLVDSEPEPDFVIFNELVQTSKDIKNLTSIKFYRLPESEK